MPDTTSPTTVRRKLEASFGTQSLVRIERRPKRADRVDGFVVGLGRKWVLVAATMDGGYFDGFVAIRIRDIARVRRDRSFEGRVSRTQPEWPPTAPGAVELDSTKGMLRTLAATSPLIGIQKERERSALWIGQLVEIDRGWLALHEVRPDATWQKRPRWYKLRAITHAQVGSHYLTGLTAVAGAAPTRRD
ncbi:hypothetical protein [Cellulomonas rhizosphaerae]|uniref:Uncharacterized protein n=1 Tax=Cellulomonas rhizosphaerae TaxID=2293719 RepID=A0A413RLQ0_9CELL|nr:hypothetical protein [Cellulomonas rhizosphaerae]RHA40985.1 hypothetical protein D1825_09350 [Cellulomonas rhizosphaerae]